LALFAKSNLTCQRNIIQLASFYFLLKVLYFILFFIPVIVDVQEKKSKINEKKKRKNLWVKKPLAGFYPQ